MYEKYIIIGINYIFNVDPFLVKKKIKDRWYH